MKPTSTYRPSASHFNRNPRRCDAASSAEKARGESGLAELRGGESAEAAVIPPFREGDVVEYLAAPGRRLIVAHCYARGMGSDRHWVVAEVNANTHLANELRRVTPA
jgi:hypothetical protein